MGKLELVHPTALGVITLFITGRGPPCTPWKIHISNLNNDEFGSDDFRISILGDFEVPAVNLPGV